MKYTNQVTFKMKKIYLTLILGIFLLSLIPMVNAEELNCWRDAKQGTNIQLLQKCDTCTFNNISSIFYQNGTEIILNEEMTKQGTNYNYTLPDNTQLGKLIYSTIGDKDGASPPKQQTLCINITPSGNSGVDNIIFYLIAIILLYVLTLLFFFKRIAPLTVLAGMAMVYFGIYMINNGILIFRNDLTNYIAYITSFLGGGLALWALVEWIQDTM